MLDSLQKEINAIRKKKKQASLIGSGIDTLSDFKMFFKLPLSWRNNFLENRWLGFENVIRHNSRCQENTKNKADGVGNKMRNLPS